MDRSLKLRDLLKELTGVENVYFQPPPSAKMKYPCIVYEYSYIDIKYADNFPFIHRKRYKVTAIDRDKFSKIPDKISEMQTVSFDRFYATDGLNHWVYILYY